MLREFENTGFIRVLVFLLIMVGALILLIMSQVPQVLSANLLQAMH